MRRKSLCRHQWREIHQHIKGKEIELRLICGSCRKALVEIYTIAKTFTLDKDEQITGEVRVYK